MQIMRSFEFDAGHRIVGHESKCAHLHGHRYKAEVTVDAAVLDDLGRVVDFSVIKDTIGKWIDEWWDHNMLLNSQDPLCLFFYGKAEQEFGPDVPNVDPKIANIVFNHKNPYIFENKNPTAENIAAELFNVCINLLPESLLPCNVRIWETPNCWADFRITDMPQFQQGHLDYLAIVQEVLKGKTSSTD